MKMSRVQIMMFIGFISIALMSIPTDGTFAQGVEVTKEKGHVAPVKIEVNFTSGAKKTGLLLHNYSGTANQSNVVVERKRKGGGQIVIYHDTLSTIKDISGEYGLYVFKDGTEERIDLSPNFWLVTPNDARENLDWKKIESVKYLEPPLQDKDGNAMFAHWKYSPYTGEKLPEN